MEIRKLRKMHNDDDERAGMLYEEGERKSDYATCEREKNEIETLRSSNLLRFLDPLPFLLPSLRLTNSSPP